MLCKPSHSLHFTLRHTFTFDAATLRIELIVLQVSAKLQLMDLSGAATQWRELRTKLPTAMQWPTELANANTTGTWPASPSKEIPTAAHLFASTWGKLGVSCCCCSQHISAQRLSAFAAPNLFALSACYKLTLSLYSLSYVLPNPTDLCYCMILVYQVAVLHDIGNTIQHWLLLKLRIRLTQ